MRERGTASSRPPQSHAFETSADAGPRVVLARVPLGAVGLRHDLDVDDVAPPMASRVGRCRGVAGAPDQPLLVATTGGATAAPMIICLHANDITCSNNYFLGRDRAEHVAQIRALLAGLAGLILIGSSGLWSARARRATRK